MKTLPDLSVTADDEPKQPPGPTLLLKELQRARHERFLAHSWVSAQIPAKLVAHSATITRTTRFLSATTSPRRVVEGFGPSNALLAVTTRFPLATAISAAPPDHSHSAGSACGGQRRQSRLTGQDSGCTTSVGTVCNAPCRSCLALCQSQAKSA